MKKYVMLVLSMFLVSCANCNRGCDKAPEPTPVPEPAVVEEPVVEENCDCNICPPDKHPRIIEEAVIIQPNQPCGEISCAKCHCDNVLPCEDQARQVVTYVPEQPEAYVLASNRAFNRFIKDTAVIYQNNPNVKLFVEQGILNSNDLPEGIDEGVKAFRTNLLNSRTFQLTGDKNKADYLLNTKAEWFDTPSKDVPAINYIIQMKDRNGNLLGSWSQIAKRANNKQWL